MLPKTRRITKEFFPKAYKKGRVFRSKNFSLFILRAQNQRSKFSFVVSSKIVKKATERNKIKRRGNAVITKNLSNLKEGYILIFVLKSYNSKVAFQEFEKSLCQLLKKANIL